MVPSIPYITVHDSVKIRETSNHGYDFGRNGLRILSPTSCIVTEERNGEYICEIEHPIDNYGKWETLKEFNILSVPIMYHGVEKRQLFRIKKVEPTMSDDGQTKIYALAEHVFYDLTARVIVNGEFENLNCYNAIKSMKNQVYIDRQEWYQFTFSSNIQDLNSMSVENESFTSVLIGDDNSICTIYDGELYRDNYYFSINKEKEGSIHHPVPIRYGVNMLSIKATVDWTDFCNFVHAYDNFGNSIDVSYVDLGSAFGLIEKSIQCNYTEPDTDKLYKDMLDYFDRYRKPIINYQIKFADLRNHELYKDFLQLKDYEVGDTVTIINERLGISTESKIVRKVYDVLRRKTLEIEFGEQKGSIIRRPYKSETIFNSKNDVKALQKLQKLSVNSTDTRRIATMTEEEYNSLQEKDIETIYVIIDDETEVSYEA